MTQEVKIPVTANTQGAQKQAEQLADAFQDVAGAVGAIGPATQRANRGLSDLVRRTREARAMLSRELRQDISAADTVTFMRNFAGMQPRSQSLRGFRTEGDWFAGHHTLFSDPRRAAEHRRRVLTYGMQGTRFARENPGAMSPPGGGGGGGGIGEGGGGSDFSRGLARTQSAALGFGRSMLALAGIGSIMAMAGRSVDLATEESTSNDMLKRRMGDLGIEFNRLRDKARSAGDGLGITFVESQRLASAYTREVGNLGKTDLEGLGGTLRNAYGFSRAYGVDPAAGTQFFGQMARFGVGRDEAGARRLALLIGDSVAQSGYGGKVEDLMQSIADYTAAASRMTLTVANSGAYANALTSLASRGIPGLDPQSAAALMSSADSAVRRGGAMGEASLNFSYAALRNANPGMNPAQAMALMEGGLFGTTRGVFGKGPNGEPNPLARFMGRGIRLDDTTNFEKMMPLLRREYGNGGYFLNAVKNHFGLSSHAQAAALADMSDRGLLGASSRVLDATGIDPLKLNASGLQMVGTLANAKGGGLDEAFQAIVNRKDVTAAQRRALLAAVSGARSGGEEATRRAMVSAVAGLNIAQEKTLGTETRDAITDLTNKLTRAGGPLLSVLNPIREAVVRLAEQFVPGYMDLSGTDRVTYQNVDPKALSRGMADPKNAAFEKDAMDFFMQKGWKRHQAAAIVGRMFVESSYKPRASNDVKGGHRGLFQWDANRWRAFERFARAKGYANLDDPRAQMDFADHELRTTERAWGEMLGGSRNIAGASKAMIGFERPEGYDPLHLERGRGYNVGAAVATRLASQNAAPAAASAQGQPTHVTGEATVHIHDSRSGQKHTVTVPLTSSAGRPRPAGVEGGRAPLVGGTIRY